ncbi:hypothetical protein [Actinomadura rudentiformis]|uniref:Uncharacterized protein n=1 Tax=Actinomadura rudentiformis TaxID=359158 RepID=A0A6H9YKA8_9ACTN|nr:hypothetical protein [Actinomadura rudentiformis]KAB2344853.1 hypothetical protein F8566_30135 [Actinomadura rudentiformis]
MKAWRARRELISLAQAQRTERITTIEALCRVVEISPLPPEQAIEWFVELVHQLDELGRAPARRGRPKALRPLKDALNHLVPA